MNSNFFISLLAGTALAGGAKLYTDHEDAVRDRLSRRTILIKLLSEYEQRISRLNYADQDLNEFWGKPPGIQKVNAHKGLTGSQKTKFDKVSRKVRGQESDIIQGSGSYVSTSPEFKNVDILTIASQMEDAAGIVEDRLSAIRILGFLSSDRTITWIFVRAYLPMMTRVATSHFLLLGGDEIPLMRGQKLSKRQEDMIGIPQLKPGELERLQKENDAAFANLHHSLNEADAEDANTQK